MNQKEAPLKVRQNESKSKLPIHLVKTAVLGIFITEKIFYTKNRFETLKPTFSLGKTTCCIQPCINITKTKPAEVSHLS
jgi:hypothetical protein